MIFTTYKLSEIGPVCMCKRILKSETNNKGGIPFYKIGSFGKTTDVFIDKEKFELYKSKYPYPKKGDILISAAGSIGKTVIFDGKDSYFQDSNIVWIDNDETKVLNPYLQYCYKNAKWKTTIGNTIIRLYNDGIRNTEIRVPSIPEQKKITVELNKIQSLIDNKKQQLSLLDEAVKSEFVEMFGENPVESGKWNVESLGDVCSSIVRGPFGSALKKDFFVPKSNDTVKVYEQKHAIQKSADIGTYYITKEKYEELKRFECKSGDFLMSCSGTMGEFYQLPEGCEKGIINQALCKFTLNDKLNSIMFLEWMKHSISNLETKGSGIKNVAAVSFVKQMPMFIPPKDIQNKFTAFVQQIDKSKFVVKQQIVDLQELLDSKMQEYFGD